MAAGLTELESLYAEIQPLLMAAGVDTTPPAPPRVAAQIAQVEATIAPHSLHPHLKWFWQTWPILGGPCGHPLFTEPTSGLAMRDETLIPPSLYEIGYADYVYLFAELAGVSGHAGPPQLANEETAATGPRIYVYGMFEELGLRLIFTGLADLLRSMLIHLEMGRGINFLAQADQLAALLPSSVLDDDKRSIDPGDAGDWPARWQRAAGITAESFRLRGATHTVAEFENARGQGPVQATLVGVVTNRAGSGQGSVARLTDDSGSIELLVPNSLFNLGTSGSARYEIDVTAARRTGPEATAKRPIN